MDGLVNELVQEYQKERQKDGKMTGVPIARKHILQENFMYLEMM